MIILGKTKTIDERLGNPCWLYLVLMEIMVIEWDIFKKDLSAIIKLTEDLSTTNYF